MVNGMYNEAADEFEKCLAHRLALPCRETRGVADAHVRRAQALFYASTLEGADKVGQKIIPSGWREKLRRRESGSEILVLIFPKDFKEF